MPDERENAIERSWDENAGAWIDAIRNDRIRSRSVATNAAVLAAVSRCRGARVLDVGCGEGWLCRALANAGRAPTGIDGAEALIAEARRAGAGDYRLLRYEQFAADPTLAGGPFDVVVCNFALLAEDIAPLLRACAAALAPHGRLIIQTLHPHAGLVEGRPYRDSWRTENFCSMDAAFTAAMPWFFRTFGSWISQIRDAGLAVRSCDEPLDPETELPVSLLLSCELLAPARQRDLPQT